MRHFGCVNVMRHCCNEFDEFVETVLGRRFLEMLMEMRARGGKEMMSQKENLLKDCYQKDQNQRQLLNNFTSKNKTSHEDDPPTSSFNNYNMLLLCCSLLLTLFFHLNCAFWKRGGLCLPKRFVCKTRFI